MQLADLYYENGSIVSKFKGPNLKKVNDILYKLFIGNDIKKGFSFQSKYKNSSDLRPNVIDYDDCFIKLLFESEVHNLIFDCIGADYLLSHIQIRKLEAGNTYLDWHRDSYNYGKKVGDFPPAHKIIYHPLFEGMSNNSKLVVSRSSQLKMYNSKVSDLFHNLINIDKNKRDFYFPSNSEFLLFNGSAFHKVCSDHKPSICLIYSFLRKNQLKKGGPRYTTLSEKTYLAYEKKLLI